MASPTTSKALIRKAEKADIALMPPPPTKRIKRPATVLDEDTYTSALSEIIARDFFPGLVESQHQQEYLDALDSQDSEWIASASRRLTEVMTTPVRQRRGTGFSTPRFDSAGTPIRETANPMATGSAKTAGVDTNMSLDQFQSKYTSEDNESFNTLLDAQNEKRRKAYAFLWNGNRIPGFRGKAALALKEREEAENEQKLLENGGEVVKTITAPDTRRPVPNTWEAEPRNGLMFIPDGSPPPPSLTDAQTERENELPPKAISHANTRLRPEAPEVPPSPSSTLVRDALAGRRPHPTDSESGTGFSTVETPRVNGYSFVADAPSPSPSELGAPPLTWGNVASLSSTDRAPTPSPFKIAATPKREALHHRMVEKVAKSKRPVSVSGAARTPANGNGTGTTASTRITILGGAGKGREIPQFKSSPALTPAGERLWAGLAGRRDTGLREALTVGRKGTDSKAAVGAGGRGFRWIPTPMAERK